MSEGMIIRRGGGASLKATDALLRVQAPAGSTVTISKGTTAKIDLGHENADDHTLYDYYFIIHQSQFDSVNPWTVTATLGTSTASSTIIIDAADEYDVELSYRLYLYNHGTIETAISGGLVTGGNYGVTPTRTFNADNFYMRGAGASQSGANGTEVTDNLIDITPYSKLCAVFSALSTTGTTTSAYIGVTSQKADGRRSTFTAFEIANSANTVCELDISSLNSAYYIGVGGAGNANMTWSFNLVELWLEQ